MRATIRLKMEPLEPRDVPAASGLYALGGGPGGSPRVKVFDTATGNLLADFLAYEANFSGGVNVAIGDVNNDGLADVVTGAGSGGGPRVRVFNGKAFRDVAGFPQAPTDGSLISPSTVIADYFAFEIEQRGGVYVTCGNITGIANFDVIVGAGPGGGPRVRVFDGFAITLRGTSYAANQPGDVTADFFAFESSFRNGVTVSASPALPGATALFLVAAPGNGGGPRVRVLSGPAISTKGTLYNTFGTGDVVADFFSGNAGGRGGAFVSAADFTTDGIPEVVVGTGFGVVGGVTVYSGSAIVNQGQNFSGTQGGDIVHAFQVGGGGYTNGVTVGNAVVTSTNSGLLLHGYGGQGLVGHGILSQFTTFIGGISRQVLDDNILDNTARGVFVGN